MVSIITMGKFWPQAGYGVWASPNEVEYIVKEREHFYIKLYKIKDKNFKPFMNIELVNS